MTQMAIVKNVLPDNKVLLSVIRTTACGGNCSECEACAYQTEFTCVADNPLNAKPGERVTVETNSSHVYKAVFAVYIIPIAVFIVSCFAAALAGCSEGLCILISFLSLAVCAALLVVFNKKKKKDEIRYTVISIG